MSRRAVYVTDISDPMFGRKAWSGRYDSTDAAMGRPIHARMSVAPPWAKMLRVKKSAHGITRVQPRARHEWSSVATDSEIR